MKVAIIGAGVSGLICAIELGRDSSFDIDIYEKNVKCARKLLASGNGRCNISNTNVSVSKYNNPNFASKIILDSKDMNSYLEDLGILLRIDEEGRVYPFSLNSNTVYDCFMDNLNKKNTHIIYKKAIDSVYYKNKKYIVDNKEYDAVVVCVGSTADEKYDKNPIENSLSKLGHKFTKCIPSLSSIPVLDKISSLDGIRVKCLATLNVDNEEYKKEGEVIFKKDEISGICIFELSHILSCLSRKKKISKAYINLDLLKEEPFDYSKHNFIDAKYKKTNNLYDTLDGVFVKKLSKEIIDRTNALIKKQNNIPHEIRITSKSSLLNEVIHKFRLDIDLNRSPSVYQVINGGIDTYDVYYSLESKLKKNLYFGGEILDVNGDCGGFNIHFAISCGLKIAESLRGKKNEK